MKIESRSKQTFPSLILASICDHPMLVIRNKQISVESVSKTEPNTSIGQCHPISTSEDQRQDLEAIQGSTHEFFPVTCPGGAASAESICRHAQNVSLQSGIFKNPKICSANCAIHEHGVKHEKPYAIRAFSPKLQAVRTPPPCGKTGTLTLRSRASCLVPANLRACVTTECKKEWDSMSLNASLTARPCAT